MKRGTRQKTSVEKAKPKIIQLVTGTWGGDQKFGGKINSSLYGLMSDGRVLQYIPASNPADAGWKRLNMRPAAPPVSQADFRDEWEMDL